MLALVPPGEAEIIYKSANLVSPFSLDVNGDGTIDFNVWMSGQTIYNFLRVNGASVAGNGVVGSFSYARALSSGAQIGPAANFVASGLMAWGWSTTSQRRREWHCFGPWDDAHKRYLGLRFMVDGEVHYGWARLNETCRHGLNSARLTGYAYETIADQGIVAGQKKGEVEGESWSVPDQPTAPSKPLLSPATLGTLAKGASAIGSWRQP